MSTKKGREYEHNLADFVVEATDGELIPLATGYNSQYSQAVDMIIDDGEAVHVFELKRTSKDAYSLYWDESSVQKDDIYRLLRFCIDYPRPAYPYVGVRFDRKQLTIAKLFIEDFPDQKKALENAVSMSKTKTGVTRDGNLRFYKPDDWPSTNLDVRDAQHVLDTIGYRL